MQVTSAGACTSAEGSAGTRVIPGIRNSVCNERQLLDGTNTPGEPQHGRGS